MITPSAKLLVFASGQLACVKIIGRANFTSSIDFKTLANELLQKGFTCFVLDLSECLLMDSTFLGVLAGFGLKMNHSASGPTNGIELLNPNPRVAELLENLGVLHLFKVTQGSIEMPECCEAPAPSSVASTKEDVTRACLEAHRTLMDLNPENVARFKDVTQFL